MYAGATRASAVAYTSTGSAPGCSHSSASKSWMSVCVKTVHGGTAPGFARPGSRVSERISWTWPTVPAATAACAAANPASKRRLKPTCSVTPAASTAASTRSISARVIDAGFSQKTGLPAPATATISSACAVEDAVITTASTPGSSIRACGSSYAVAP